MFTKENPPHALFVKWGRFQAGAFGWPAVVTLAILGAVIGMLLLR
jgi:hypothetical protein